MSHFFLLVLVPAGAEDVARAVANLMAPYDPDLELDEYQQCFCVRNAADQRAMEEAIAHFGTLDKLTKEFATAYVRPEGLNETELCHHKRQAWREYARDFSDFYEDRFREFLKSMAADPECDDCAGTGRMTYQYNPDSHWDSWQIGGRWTGVLTGYDPEADPRNLEICRSCAGTGRRINFRDGSVGTCNMCEGTGQALKWPFEWVDCDGGVMPVVDIQLSTYPEAIVTPDGKWRHESEVRWLGCTSCEADCCLWKELVDALLEQHRDCTGVVVDCHI